ncbi:hypothetical protein [Holdemania sp. 1001302B_160321_E10]|uniref:hypothetical protein n=1 Tax=Holdemania sp. 1001302B_160321_E10 TaxID=2787120 RepID=UPI00189BCF75|nr:hypothetical protein [Holdemania sp. 1001302B_160321_E10]
MAGYIKIHRKLKEWEWYGDTNTMRVFLHLLLSANWKETRFKNEKIGRGECVTSLANLSNDLGLTQSQIRTALNHMEMTNTITNRRFSNYRIIKVENFDLYQANDIPEDRPLSKDLADLSTDVQQTCDESLATALATSKEYKNLRSKEVKKEEVNNSLNTCAEQVVIRLPLTGKNEHPVTQELVDQFAELYPAVDIMQELRNMKGWLINNPERRKTKSGINRFINRWLAKAQNQSRGNQQPVPQKKGSTNPFLEMLERGEFDE